MALTVAGIDDRKGLAEVHAARMKVKNLRLAIEKRRKELKASALEYGRQVDDAAKELSSLLAPIESHLENEEGIVERERKRLRDEAEAARQAKIRARLEDLKACDVVALASDVEHLSDDEFTKHLAQCLADKKTRDDAAAAAAAEQARIAEQQRLAAEQLAKERAEMDRIRKEQEAAQARIDAENRRIEMERAEQNRQAELEKARQEAAEKAKQAAEEDQRRKQAEEKARVAAEEAEQKRIESLRPDHEKLSAVADAVEAISIPEVSSGAKSFAGEVRGHLRECAMLIRASAKAMVKKK